MQSPASTNKRSLFRFSRMVTAATRIMTEKPARFSRFFDSLEIESSIIDPMRTLNSDYLHGR